MRRASLAFIGALLFVFSSFGQESKDAEQGFLFTARAFGDDLFEGIRYSDADKEVQELTFDPRYRTPVYALPRGAREATFFRMVADEDGREHKETVAVADFEGIDARALLVFLAKPDTRRGLPYTVLVADESPGAFEAGHLRFLNLSGPSLMARVGDESFPLGFGFSGDVSFDPEALEEMPFEFAVRVGDAWKIVYSTGFRTHPNVGTLAILKPPARAGSLRIQVELRRMRVYPELKKESEDPSG